MPRIGALVRLKFFFPTFFFEFGNFVVYFVGRPVCFAGVGWLVKRFPFVAITVAFFERDRLQFIR